MAQFNFSCPHCNQLVQADDQWSGQEIQCPACAGAIVVPQNAAAPAPTAPQKPGSRLKVTAAAHTAATPTPPQPPPSMSRPSYPAPRTPSKVDAAKWIKLSVVLIFFGVGAYFGFNYLSKMQSKVSEDKGSGDGGEVGHIMALNDVLDRTEPDHMGMSSKEAASAKRHDAKLKAQFEAEAKRYGETPRNAVSTQQGNAVVSASADMANLPLASGVWSMDADPAAIPEGRANGMISGTNFVVDTAVLVKVGPSQILTLRQGTNVASDRELFITFQLAAGEELSGHNWNISQEMKGKGVPQVIKRWKTNPRYAPTKKAFATGYTMKLELGQATNGVIDGKISVSLPDPEQSYVVGAFKAALLTPGAN